MTTATIPHIIVHIDRPGWLDTWAPGVDEDASPLPVEVAEADDALEAVRARAERRAGVTIDIRWTEGYGSVDVEGDDDLGGFAESFRGWPQADEISETLDAIQNRRWHAEHNAAPVNIFATVSDVDLEAMKEHAWREAARCWAEARSAGGYALLVGSAESADDYWQTVRNEQEKRRAK